MNTKARKRLYDEICRNFYQATVETRFAAPRIFTLYFCIPLRDVIICSNEKRRGLSSNIA